MSGPTSLRWWVLFVAPFVGVALVATLAVALVVTTDGGDGATAAAPPLELASVPDEIAAHYRHAETHQSGFSAVPCFCGCEQFLAHENLYDCFVRADGAGYDSHAAGCGVCIGEATVATELLDAGMRPAGVAARIVAQFGSTPVTSPDQTTIPT